VSQICHILHFCDISVTHKTACQSVNKACSSVECVFFITGSHTCEKELDICLTCLWDRYLNIWDRCLTFETDIWTFETDIWTFETDIWTFEKDIWTFETDTWTFETDVEHLRQISRHLRQSCQKKCDAGSSVSHVLHVCKLPDFFLKNTDLFTVLLAYLIYASSARLPDVLCSLWNDVYLVRGPQARAVI